MAKPSNKPSLTERGKSGARLRLDAALEAAEDGHVAGLQVRRASWRDEAERDVRERPPHGSQSVGAGVNAGHVPEKDQRLSFSARVQHVVQCGCDLQERRRVAPAALGRDVMSVFGQGCSGKTASCPPARSSPACPEATIHAEGDRECRGLLCVALQLSLFDAAVAPPSLVHRQEAARGVVVDVHDAVCADCVLVHEPAQLDEQPVRVVRAAAQCGGALSSTWRASGSSAHATQEFLHPALAGTDVESHCVEPVVRQASDRHSAEAQDVSHSQDALA